MPHHTIAQVRLGEFVYFRRGESAPIQRTVVREVGKGYFRTYSQHYVCAGSPEGEVPAYIECATWCCDYRQNPAARGIVFFPRDSVPEEMRKAVDQTKRIIHPEFIADPGEPRTIIPNGPLTHLAVGTEVFCIITPKTRLHDRDAYSPPPYGILSDTIMAAHLDYRGTVRHEGSESFYWGAEEIFTDLEQARATLMSRFERETGGTIRPENIKMVTAGALAENRKWHNKQVTAAAHAHFRDPKNWHG